MADARIDVLGMDDLPLVVDLYNQIYRPPHDEAFFRRRFLGRHNALILTAVVEGHPIGFFLGFELKPSVYFTWLYGVLPAYTRQGIASQLCEAAHAWAHDNGYAMMRMECHNQHRPMLHLAIKQKYDIVGIRWDSDRGDNLVIFEKMF